MFHMSKKNAVISVIIVFLLVLTVNMVSKMFFTEEIDYISGNSQELSYDDVRDYLKKVDFSGDNSREYFKDDLINKYTLKFFKYLQEIFKEMNYEQHIEAVRKYLYDSMESEKADKLLEIYKKFLDYENRIAAELSGMKDLNTTEDFLKVLRRMREMQVEIFGEKNADIIFGASLKSQEYPIRRAGIINDKNLYGKEKEEKIRQLNKEMWGSDSDEMEKNRKPYTRYTEKIEAYSKDLSEMGDEEKSLKVKEFRNEIFSPDIVQRLEEVDNLMEEEKQKELSYLSAVSEINGNKELSEKEKKDMIYNLQNKTFGDEADSVRRREEMEAGKKEMIDKYNAN